MSPKRHANDRPVDAPTDERRPTRRSNMAANDQLTHDEAVGKPDRLIGCPRHLCPTV